MPKSVLLAEDQAGIRDLIVLNLQQAGYAVTAVADGKAALAHQLERASDLLLLDLMMPGLAWRCVRRCAPAAAPHPS